MATAGTRPAVRHHLAARLPRRHPLLLDVHDALDPGASRGRRAAGGACPRRTSPDDLWLEGDQLLFTDGELGHQVYSVPVSGGTPQLIMDGAAGRTDVEWPAAFAITPTDIFWVEGSPGRLKPPSSVWRAARGGGAPSLLATTSSVLPRGDVNLFSNIAVAPDADRAGIHTRPRERRPTRRLAGPVARDRRHPHRGNGDFAGIDAAGVYWTVPKPGALEENDEWIVALAPVDGSPARIFWQGLPAHSGVRDMWPDGAGGWVVVASQLFDDQHGFMRRSGSSTRTATGGDWRARPTAPTANRMSRSVRRWPRTPST